VKIEKTPIDDLLVITPPRFSDDRGFFSESWNKQSLHRSGICLPDFVQDNHSMSRRCGTLRGLHFQSPPHEQGKLVRCGHGRLFDVAVDVRVGSKTFGRWFGTELSFANGRQLWIPAGFLHGFVTLEDDTEVIYKCTDHYAPDCDGAVRWDSLDIDWGLKRPPILSERDAAAAPFADFESPFRIEKSG
jgi:dTDP-4-dehydrorhamnose 3,5-epimerase